MNIRGMHYDFKQKINKIDSQKYKNLRIPEIDWKLNEAILLFIKMVAEPKYAIRLGFESTQRVIDDIRTIVVNDESLVLSPIDDNSILAVLPNNYSYYAKSSAIISQGECTKHTDTIFVRTHNDEFRNSPFDISSFQWGEVNIRFFDRGIKIFTENDFDVREFKLDYIREPVFVHNAQDFPGGQYEDFEGNMLTGSVDCDLPSDVHSEIVDLAVLITTGNLQIPDYQIKKDKLTFNQLVRGK